MSPLHISVFKLLTKKTKLVLYWTISRVTTQGLSLLYRYYPLTFGYCCCSCFYFYAYFYYWKLYFVSLWILMSEIKFDLTYETKIPVLCYILSDQVWWYDVKQFLSYSKKYICKFMQVNSWQHKLFHFHVSFWIWKVWKVREKITKIWLSQERKERFR